MTGSSSAMVTLLAVIATVATVWLWLGPRPGLARLVATPGPVVAASTSRRSGPVWVVRLPVALLVPAGLLVGGPQGAAVGLACSLAGLSVHEVWRRRSGRAARLHERQQVVLAAETMSGLLLAGRVPTVALREAAEEAPLLETVIGALATGGDIPDALRGAARTPGREGLARLADAWEVAARSGAPQAQAWERAAEALVAEDEVSRLVTTEVAAARAAGRLMALLPLVGIGLGYLMGGDPADFLLGTPAGWVCLVAAVALVCVGVLWIDHIAESAGVVR